MEFLKVAEFLNIRKPYKVAFSPKLNKKALAEHEFWYNPRTGKPTKHLITIFLGGWNNSQPRTVETVIAHELVHAKQAEMGFKDYHGVWFQLLCGYVLAEFPQYKGIYIPEIDGNK